MGLGQFPQAKFQPLRLPVPLVRTPVIKHQVQRNCPRPRPKIRARLEAPKLFPHDDFRLLQNVVRVRPARQQAINIGCQSHPFSAVPHPLTRTLIQHRGQGRRINFFAQAA